MAETGVKIHPRSSRNYFEQGTFQPPLLDQPEFIQPIELVLEDFTTETFFPIFLENTSIVFIIILLSVCCRIIKS